VVALREVIGDVLRTHRTRQGRTLRQVSVDARVSLGYISEVERGQKEASSELIAALCGALDVPLSQVLGDASEQMLVIERSADALSARVSDLPIRTVATPPAVAAA
jgi:transcriptional regulator with XRE-family HTH domain